MAEALAFDMYGTLVDPIRISERLEQHAPEPEAVEIATLWRQKQLEYAFRLTVMGAYEDFQTVTRKALDYALTAAGRELDGAACDALIAQYNDLERFPDVEPGLSRLKRAGHQMIVFSNGSPAMLEPLMDAAGLRPFFDGYVSVDEIGVYKPAPAVYRHAAERLGRPIGEVRLVSSNPFDDVGAQNAGMRTAWVDRSGGQFDTLGTVPELVVGSLTELADALDGAS